MIVDIITWYETYPIKEECFRWIQQNIEHDRQRYNKRIQQQQQRRHKAQQTRKQILQILKGDVQQTLTKPNGPIYLSSIPHRFLNEPDLFKIDMYAKKVQRTGFSVDRYYLPVHNFNKFLRIYQKVLPVLWTQLRENLNHPQAQGGDGAATKSEQT